jgi:hypothetical protein
MKNELAELFYDTYKRTVEDNKEDFMKIIGVISKLCTYLIIKNVLTQEEVSKILDLDIDINKLVDLEN